MAKSSQQCGTEGRGREEGSAWGSGAPCLARRTVGRLHPRRTRQQWIRTNRSILNNSQRITNPTMVAFHASPLARLEHCGSQEIAAVHDLKRIFGDCGWL